MKVTLNGQTRVLDPGLTIQGLLESLKMEADLVAVELNLAILPKARFADTRLKEGDSVEIVRFVGGGQSVTSGAYTAAPLQRKRHG